jgi:hypothetical protein
MQKRNARLMKEKLEFELDLREKDTFPCDFSKVVRRFYLALFTNLLFLESFLLFFSVLVVLDYPSDPTGIPIPLVIGGVGLGLIFPACYLLGRHMLKMGHNHESLQTMPPLIDDAYNVVLSKTLKSNIDFDHPERAKKMYALYRCAGLMLAVCYLWFFACYLDWNRNPVPCTICLGLILSVFFAAQFFCRRFRNDKRKLLLGWTIAGFVFSGTTLLLLMFQSETFSLKGLWLDLFFNPKPFLLGRMLMPMVLIFFLMSPIGFLRWVFYKEKPDKQESYSRDELEAAIARYETQYKTQYESPHEPEVEHSITPFPTVWRWVAILYGAISFAVIGLGVLFWSL